MWPTGRRLSPFAVAAVGTPLLSVLLARRRLAVITVAGASMEPAYRSGDRVLLRRLGRRGGAGIENGGVVVAAWRPPSGAPPEGPAVTHGGPRRTPGEPLGARSWMIKRVVACPGDPVPEGLGPALAAEAGRPAPRDRFVVLGDNAAHSHDSRHIGYLERGDILGVVIRRLGPRR
ncbi:S26 family signal peptidase [Streptomyces glomeratus]|uniref:signal peptidase I n=1 Tax=Streptomyces glomeratus TaxID=284452 RepID=A0ABP6LJE3_9ACTN|nr:S26 family signal peptidase [Streptomyces glomeratus]